MITLKVNDQRVSVKAGSTVLQACEAAAVEVPRFCYHERLGIAGNCRMCLVEIDKSPKPQASCARPVRPNRVVYTDTPLVKKAREAVLEFLLRNHPLDCPICDQGGECDLQDQSRVFGSDRSRVFGITKRSVEDKNWGPLVKTVRTRCIQCTRCVRFASEVAGVSVLGATGRGRDVEIGTYVNKPFLSEISANVIDLCPVGALTSQGAKGPFTFRPWELVSTDSYDVTDARLSSIRVQSRGGEIRRVLPRVNDERNGEWATDKGRYAPVDGTRQQRLRTSYVQVDDGRAAVTDQQFAGEFSRVLSGSDRVRVIRSATVNRECTAGVLQALQSWGKPYSAETLAPRAYGAYGEGSRSRIQDLSTLDTSSLILLLGCDPRRSAPLLNSRIRKAYLSGAVVASRGPALDLGYPVHHRGYNLLDDERIAKVEDWVKSHSDASGAGAGAGVVVVMGTDILRQVRGAEVMGKFSAWALTRASLIWLPNRANEWGHRTEFSGELQPFHGTSPFLRDCYASAYAQRAGGASNSKEFQRRTLLVGITESELRAAGGSRSELLDSTTTRVLAWKGEDWRARAHLIRPLPRPLAVESSYVGMTGDVSVAAAVPQRRGVGVGVVADLLAKAGPSSTVFAGSPQQHRGNRGADTLSTALWLGLGNSKGVAAGAAIAPRLCSLVNHHQESHAMAEGSATQARTAAYWQAHQGNFALWN